MARDYFHSLPLPSISLFREMGMEEQDLGHHQYDNVSEISDEPTLIPASIRDGSKKTLSPFIVQFPANTRDGSQEQMLQGHSLSIHDGSQDTLSRGVFFPNQQPFPGQYISSYPPSLSKGSRLRSKRERFGNLWFMIMVACMITTFSIYYSYRVLVSHAEVPKRLAMSPGKTVLVVNILSHAVALLCLHLFVDTSEALRWAWACNPRTGILFTSFLALSRATPLSGVWHLMFRKGGHQIWCFFRLLALILYQTIGLILIADITFKTIYNTSENSTPIKVIAGTAPFNSAYISLIPKEIVATFATSYTQGFLTDPRYVTSIPPVNCTANCTSIFLPGSLELVRIDNGYRNATLFKSHLEGDSLLINGAPGYQVEFSSLKPEFKFNSTECKMTMHSLGDGLWMCAASDGMKMNVGWSICPNEISLTHQCTKNTSWTDTLDQSTSVAIYKRYATTAYDFRNLSILSIESITAPRQKPIDAKDFSFWLDLVLGPVPKVLNFSSPTTFRAAAATYSVQMSLGWILRLYKTDYNAYNDGGLKLLQGFIAVSLQFSTSIWQQMSLSTLPTDMKVTATVVSSSYRAMIPFWAVVLFGALACLLLLWSISCLAWVYFLGPPTPNSSPFAEVDITSKSNLPLMMNGRTDDLGRYMRENGMGNCTGRQAMRGMRRRKVYCGAAMDPRTGEPIIAIVTERGVVTPLQEHAIYA